MIRLSSPPDAPLDIGIHGESGRLIRPSSIKSAPDGPGFAGLSLNCTIAPGIAKDSSSPVTCAENAAAALVRAFVISPALFIRSALT